MDNPMGMQRDPERDRDTETWSDDELAYDGRTDPAPLGRLTPRMRDIIARVLGDIRHQMLDPDGGHVIRWNLEETPLLSDMIKVITPRPENKSEEEYVTYLESLNEKCICGPDADSYDCPQHGINDPGGLFGDGIK